MREGCPHRCVVAAERGHPLLLLDFLDVSLSSTFKRICAGADWEARPIHAILVAYRIALGDIPRFVIEEWSQHPTPSRLPPARQPRSCFCATAKVSAKCCWSNAALGLVITPALGSSPGEVSRQETVWVPPRTTNSPLRAVLPCVPAKTDALRCSQFAPRSEWRGGIRREEPPWGFTSHALRAYMLEPSLRVVQGSKEAAPRLSAIQVLQHIGNERNETIFERDTKRMVWSCVRGRGCHQPRLVVHQ